jgi:PiT family inorganic phosphate transporter
MYKRLQLLSSAAFSLGHGGADSQKVMGIICAALMVYGNYARKENISVDKNLQVSELIQIEHTNEKGKIEKFKPETGVINDVVFYADGDDLIDMNTQEVIFKEEKLVSTYSKANLFSTFKKADSELGKLHVYSKGKSFYDSETDELIFEDKELSKNYSKAGVFANYVVKQEIRDGFKIKGKIHSDTMPFWISFGCYFMIGIGTLMGGWKIVKTMGTKITKVTPLEGVCAETAGALTLFTVSNMGIPVSTTHTITGSIIGVGAIKRLSAVRWGVTINLLWAWILTIPVSGLLAAGFYYLILLFK